MAKKESAKKGGEPSSTIARNKKAYHNYEVIATLECGLVLQGTEVKSLRNGGVNFADAYATVKEGKLLLIGLTISEYAEGTIWNHTPTATRTLLAHRHQIRKLEAQIAQKGLTLVPLNLHWSRGMAKVEIGVVRGKAMHDKRATLKERETERERQRALRR